MPRLADVMARHGDAYLARYNERMLPSHRRTIRDIRTCRTEAMGGHVYHCKHCDREVYAYHSCKNRHCPRCHRNQTASWLAKRRDELLPVPYFHVVFTIPRELHPLFRSNQKQAYGALMRCAAHSLMKLCGDPAFVGGEIGVMAVLHTWTRDLAYHAHVHCLVPAGGLAEDGRTWLPARKDFLVPSRALSKMFRGMLYDTLQKALPNHTLPRKVFRRRKWVVYLEAASGSANAVLEYLARYVYRVAISDQSISQVTDTEVAFRYQDNDKHQWHTMCLPPERFIHRFLQHVLPRGFQKIRYFGLWHASRRQALLRLRLVLPPQKLPDTTTLVPATENPLTTQEHTCPYCGKGPLVYLRRIARPRKPP
jgi:hypothetical protein